MYVNVTYFIEHHLTSMSTTVYSPSNSNFTKIHSGKYMRANVIVTEQQ